MANKRMFSKEIVGSDGFLDLPVSSRELYFQLGMYADDDGFVTPRKVIRMIGASNDDISVLHAKGFIIPFKSGVIVIRHWKENNYLRADRYKPTIYQDEYKLACQDPVYQLDTQSSKDKFNIEKIRHSSKKIMIYKKTGERIVESPAGSGKLCIWQNGECKEYGDKKSEIEYVDRLNNFRGIPHN